MNELQYCVHVSLFTGSDVGEGIDIPQVVQGNVDIMRQFFFFAHEQEGFSLFSAQAVSCSWQGETRTGNAIVCASAIS
ncbi:MAG: hypothetical protein BWY72_02495 [Bacteroidetes bacterium ADurb.Bin416]|nr:MAG: hypothetical protein BWY72_02495 [Bacteroidetes bacterium ADurb.Bin416]